MKTVEMEHSIWLDRLATRNEVRRAMSFPSQGAPELLAGRDDLLDETDPGFGGLPEDMVWLMLAVEMKDSKSN